MGLWRSAANPWGQDVLIGVSWNLMWAALILSALFVVGHAIWARTRAAGGDLGGAGAAPGGVPAGLPERIRRHSLASRLFHWTMAVSMLVLLATAFVPVIGWQFPWVTIHWIAGVALLVTIVYHVIHVIGWQDFWSMMQLGVAEGFATLKHVMSPKAPPPPKAGKYPFDHRLFHHAIVVVGLAAIATGVLMMVRIDTPFWSSNPYLLSDSVWGVMYVVHGLAGVSLIVLTASHIYFAIRPEKRWITWSMIHGWVDREHYLAHHDPAKWVVAGERVVTRDGAGGAIADNVARAPREVDE